MRTLSNTNDGIDDVEYGRVDYIMGKFGLPRSLLYEWIADGTIESASFKKPGQRHGTRLISIESVRRHIKAHIATPESEAAARADRERIDAQRQAETSS